MLANNCKATRVFKTAEEYFRAHQKLTSAFIERVPETGDVLQIDEMPVQIRFLGPDTVLQAFSLELFFKGIIFLRSKNPPKKRHDLQGLFTEQIPKCDQEGIRLIYEKGDDVMLAYRDAVGSSKHEDVFSYALKNSSRAFKRLRYDFDGENYGEWIASDILQAVRYYCFDSFPDQMRDLRRFP